MNGNMLLAENIIDDMILRNYSFPELFHAVRYAQRISQVSLAKAGGVSQAAIAQFEQGKHTLSAENLKKLAPLINMNPEYFDDRAKNPFRQTNKNQVISMILPESPSHEINYDLLKMIINSNLRVDAVLLRIVDVPKEFSKRVLRIQTDGHLLCGFILRDVDGNLFLFRRKDKYSFLEERRIHRIISSFAIDSNNRVFIESVNADMPLLKAVSLSSKINAKTVSSLFREPERKENVKAVKELVNKLWLPPLREEDQKEKKTIEDAITKLGEEYFSEEYWNMVKDLKRVIKKYTGIKDKKFF